MIRGVAGAALFCRLVGFITLIVYSLVAYTDLANWLSVRTGTPAHVRPSDAVVVLGNYQLPQGSLGDASLRRTIEAISLFRRGVGKRILFLGSDRENGRTEAEARRNLAIDLGLTDADMRIDSTGLTTREEARVSRKLLLPAGFRRILLVTDSQHMTRAVALFRAEGFDVAPASVDEFPNPAGDDSDERWALMSRILTEITARAYQDLRN